MIPQWTQGTKRTAIFRLEAGERDQMEGCKCVLASDGWGSIEFEKTLMVQCKPVQDKAISDTR